MNLQTFFKETYKNYKLYQNFNKKMNLTFYI
jgi:hypothetical protein